MTAILIILATILFPHAGLAEVHADIQQAQSVLSETKINEFLNEWLDAQNKGQFDKYQTLYAERFTGIRRSGNRTVQLGHDAWMKDRLSMFKHPMTVGAKDIQIVLVSSGAVMMFTQDWASPTYKDTGRKRILVKEEPGHELKIVREEMLASAILSRNNEDVDRELRFAFILKPDGIILTDRASDEWGQGAPQLANDGQSSKAYEEVNLKALPVWYSNLIGKRVILRNPSGGSSNAKISGFKLISQFHGGFPGLNLDPTTHEPLEGAELAKKNWEIGARKFLIATIENDKDQEFPAEWAQSADFPPFPIAIAKSAGNLNKRIVEEFRKLNDYKRLQTAFKGSNPDTKETYWEEHESNRQDRGLIELSTPKGFRCYVFIGYDSGVGCGQGFAGSLHAIWEVTNTPRGQNFVLRAVSDRFIEIQAATDMDKNGEPKFIYKDKSIEDSFGYFSIDSSQHYNFTNYSIPFIGCPC